MFLIIMLTTGTVMVADMVHVSANYTVHTCKCTYLHSFPLSNRREPGIMTVASLAENVAFSNTVSFLLGNIISAWSLATCNFDA